MDRSERGLLWALHTVAPGRTGIDRYVTELARAIAARSDGLRYDLCVASEPSDPEWLPAEMGLQRVPGPRRLIHGTWTMLARPRVERLVGPARLVHTLTPAFPVPSRAPSVLTIHDMFPITNPEWYAVRSRVGFRRSVAYAEQEAAAVIADSSATADAAVGCFPGLVGRITVIPLGISERFRVAVPTERVAEACDRAGVRPGAYVVAVGRIGLRKNLPVVIDALGRIGAPNLSLLAIGPSGDGHVAVEAAVKRARLDGRVRLAGWLPGSDLTALIAGALALVHPSVAEGFGLTPLEAMALGTPALVAESGAIADVVGAAAIRLPATDPERWAEAIKRLADDPDWRSRVVKMGREWSSRFSWAETAARTAGVHASVIGDGAR